MEASDELEGGFLDHILPPRLEDAGLEDCALPLDAIKEAFARAATAIFNSREDDDDYCVEDLWPIEEKPTDVVVGILPELKPPGSCAAEKGLGFSEIWEDALVVSNGDIDVGEIGDMLVGGDERKEEEKACVDGCQGIKKGEKLQNNNRGEEEERPILTEGSW